jgi:hypothetical protein
MTSPEYAISAQDAADKRKAATEKGLEELFGRVLTPQT